MFDTYVHPRVTESVTRNVNVTEKRAPTDESVRLLREMEKSALDAVIKAVRVENTQIEAVIHSRVDHSNDGTSFAIVYKVNGVKEVARYEHVNRAGTTQEERRRLVDGLLEALAQSIALNLLKGLGPKLHEHLR